jgi:hypothetical protein
MRAIAFLAWMLMSGAALAQSSAGQQNENGPCWGGCIGGGIYQGPGDLVTGSVAWFGLRAFNAAALSGTQKSINIVRASDSTAKDIYILPTGGLDVNTASAFCAATTCAVAVWYDQSGLGQNLSSGAPTRGTLTFNCLGGNPCVTLNGTSQYYVYFPVGTTSQPITTSAVVTRTANFASSNVIFLSQTSPYLNGGWGSANDLFIYAGTGSATASATDSAWHALQFIANGASSFISVDNVAGTTTGSGGTGQLTATGVSIGSGEPVEADYASMNFTEIGFWPAAFTSAQQTSVCHQQYLYWGTSVAC